MRPEIHILSGKFATWIHGDTGEGRSIAEDGVWEKHLMKAIDKNCRLSGGAVIDVGAGYGANSIAFANRVGRKGFVYAIELQRIIFQALCANIFCNGHMNIAAIHAAVCEGDEGFLGWSKIDYSDKQQSCGVRQEPITDKSKQYFDSAPRITIDSLKAEDVRLIKLDIEGGEVLAIKGAMETIKRFKPALVVELSEIYLSSNGTTVEDAVEFIEELGYEGKEVSPIEMIFLPK